MVLAVLAAIAGCIHVGVPVLLDEVDRLATGVVLAAVLILFFFMPRWYAQVNGLTHYVDGRLLNNHGRRVNQLGLWHVAKVNAAVKARLANVHRNCNVSCPCGTRHRCKCGYD